MASYKMQVKLIGPHGETIDAWAHEVPAEALYVLPGLDAKTPGKCYFRPVLLTNLARKITDEMLRFLQTRGWHRDDTDPEVVVDPEVAMQEYLRAS